jgi:hypothetical protein
MRYPARLPAFCALALPLFDAASPAQEPASPAPRVRIIIETDAGGDPDDEQSLVRFLLYSNEWDVEGIIANRREARDGENLNSQRTGLRIVRQLVDAYATCHERLVQHDPRYPSPDALRKVAVNGLEESSEGVDLIIAAIDSPDPRPVWYSNWGTDHGSDPSCLKRALDRVLAERGPEGYARFKSRLRLSSDDQFGDHTMKIDPPFPIWVDTFRPELRVEGGRWYHRFSGITARAGGFDIERDVRADHGPLGALYPTNTTHPQKEGDTMAFLYLVPTGMNDPEHPGWGSWAGRYGPMGEAPGRPYFWANQRDTWQGTTSRDATLARWAAAIQNDFKARMDWCVRPFQDANHPPVVHIEGSRERRATSGAQLTLDASGSSDPDGDSLTFRWFVYPEPGTFRGDLAIESPASAIARVVAPVVREPQTVHVLVEVTDGGQLALTRYGRVIVTLEPAPSADSR